jgi:hypothetical protein
MLLGLAKTAEGVGASFSNLIGEVMAEYWGYATAFLVLSAASLLPIMLYSLCMPTAVVVVVTGMEGAVSRVHDQLSVSSHRGAGRSTHNMDLGDVQMTPSVISSQKSSE